MSTRILIVEDEQLLQQQLCQQLQEAGFQITTASDGREGLYSASEFEYELAIIDIGLPKLNGIDLVRQLREQGKRLPILILTARGNWQDKVEGLEAGADDYLVKPFVPQELEARVRALLRRTAAQLNQRWQFGPITIDTDNKQVLLSDEPLELTSFEFNTLEYLARHAGKVISKAQLTDYLYEQDFERDSNVIEVFIARLRKKLDPAGDLKPIATIRGMGYRFTLSAST